MTCLETHQDSSNRLPNLSDENHEKSRTLQRQKNAQQLPPRTPGKPLDSWTGGSRRTPLGPLVIPDPGGVVTEQRNELQSNLAHLDFGVVASCYY